MTQTPSSTEIGRVLRASTAEFTVGCRRQQLENHAFGALVKATLNRNEAVYGLIYNIAIKDDPLVQRLVLADPLAVNTIEDQRENRMLPIEMSVLALGYALGTEVRGGFPPRPPLNLDPVYIVEGGQEIGRFTDHLGYLRLILRGQSMGVPVDQLLVAHVHNTYLLRGSDQLWAQRVITELIELLRSNYDTLIPTLEALKEALAGVL